MKKYFCDACGEVIWENEEREMAAPADGEMMLDKYFSRFEVIN